MFNIYSSHELKKSVSSKYYSAMFLLFIDIAMSITFGIFNYMNYYTLPCLLLGFIGVHQFRSRILTLHQFYNMSVICLRIYTINISNELYLWSLIPITYYILYKFWYFIFLLNLLYEDDIKQLRNGWINSYDYL